MQSTILVNVDKAQSHHSGQTLIARSRLKRHATAPNADPKHQPRQSAWADWMAGRITDMVVFVKGILPVNAWLLDGVPGHGVAWG
jgi:hypothetical protein